MSLHHVFSRVSGQESADCHVIVLRSNQRDFSPGEGDSWLGSFQGSTVATHLKKAGLYTDVWRSKARRVYVADADGFVYHGIATSEATTWAAHEVGASLHGIWGLDDEHVFAWGHDEENRTVLVHWDGSAWRGMPAPESLHRVVAMHGTRPDLVVAVGGNGLVFRWDGEQWHKVVAPPLNLVSVFVVSEDEIWACGGGVLLRGDLHGCEEVLRADEPLGAVAKWRGDVWVATSGEKGLSMFRDGELESVKPKIQAHQLIAAEELLFAQHECVGSSADGQAFRVWKTAAIAGLIDGTRPLWR